jgi:glycine/D-amino acid oxidase-like deaminating enzyme
VDVIIIGSGCAAWWVSLYLAMRGISCIILDSHMPGAFASTANQGWLQSGTWHMIVGNDLLTASACRDGSDLIRFRYPKVIRPGISSYFLMPGEEDLEQCLEHCKQVDIPVRSVSINYVKAKEPLLKESPLGYAVQTPDVPMDTSLLLQIVARQACERGVHFQAVRSLGTLNPFWDGKSWRVFVDQEQEIQAKAVVLACGAYIPEMLKHFIPAAPTRFEQTKVPVMVLHGKIARSILITLHTPQGPNLVPFNGADGNGVSICLYHTDVMSSDYQDTKPPDLLLEQYQESFADFYGGLRTMIAERGDIPAHVYMCQKLHLADNPYGRAAICSSYAPEPTGTENLFVFYPGKFTAAPVVAKTCVEAVERCLGDQRTSHAQIRGATLAPTIAKQRYYNAPQYLLTVRNRKLVFQPIE